MFLFYVPYSTYTVVAVLTGLTFVHVDPSGYLAVGGIGRVSCTCRHLRDACADERIWVSLWEGPLPRGFLTGGRAAHVALWLLAKGAVEQVILVFSSFVPFLHFCATQKKMACLLCLLTVCKSGGGIHSDERFFFLADREACLIFAFFSLSRVGLCRKIWHVADYFLPLLKFG